MKEAYLIGAARKTNGSGDTSEFDEIISELRNLGEKPAKLIPNLIRKPLVDCIYCMGGFYTLIVSFILGYGLHSLLMAGSCIFVAGLFYEILYKLEK